ncbi:hypothetical protein K7432_004594 [Basidiobolus ranarum]|uniref:Yeast cell wall synthesis Kre9/Knh1-like N-terminal domain-containing protein n=1 Tax=Basidiobolus ranarum TaxID=34480 RepID=A0ABR2WY22_9FUNG
MLSIFHLALFFLFFSASSVYGIIDITSPSGGSIQAGTTVAIIWREVGGQLTPNLLSFQLYQGDATTRQPVTAIVSPIEANARRYDWYVSPIIDEGVQYSIGATLPGVQVFSPLFFIVNPNSSLKNLVHPKNQAIDASSANSTNITETTNTVDNSTVANNANPFNRNNAATQLAITPKFAQFSTLLLAIYSMS